MENINWQYNKQTKKNLRRTNFGRQKNCYDREKKVGVDYKRIVDLYLKFIYLSAFQYHNSMAPTNDQMTYPHFIII